jgi:transposase
VLEAVDLPDGPRRIVSQGWRDGNEVVAIDPSATFRRAVRNHLPHPRSSAYTFHLVKLGHDVVTQVRQRVTLQAKGRRGRLGDPAWVNRRLLLLAGDTLAQARPGPAQGDVLRRRPHG